MLNEQMVTAGANKVACGSMRNIIEDIQTSNPNITDSQALGIISSFVQERLNYFAAKRDKQQEKNGSRKLSDMSEGECGGLIDIAKFLIAIKK